MGLGIGGLSLPKLPEIQEMAELAVAVNSPLSTLTIGAKLAENFLQGVMMRDSLNRKLDAPQPDAFAALKTARTNADD